MINQTSNRDLIKQAHLLQLIFIIWHEREMHYHRNPIKRQTRLLT